MAKLYENAWRLMNIAFADEMETLCSALDLDPREVAEACRTKPFGFVGFAPGPGAGGRCIPLAGEFLANAARSRLQPTPLLAAGIAANRARPSVIAERVLGALGEGTDHPVLAVGVTYKANVADIRESPALAVVDHLVAAGVEVDFHDPYVPELRLAGRDLRGVELSPESLERYACVVILTAHDVIVWALIANSGLPVVDTRQALTRAQEPEGRS
jgi:UDP-N-acetyl-D-glucosamine dehydrogenase